MYEVGCCDYSSATANLAIGDLKDDKTVNVEKDDPVMLAAFAKAHATTDQFIAILQANSGYNYAVKVKIQDTNGVEYFWLSNLTYANGVFSGDIDNDPEIVKNVKSGQHMEVQKADIYDWDYMKGGKMYGNYTARALLPKLSKEDADQMRALLAPE
jgi:uncharacterized protein YegJ (DUF2314 family)